MKKLILTGIIAFAGCTHLNSQNWSLLGNGGTVDGINFLGTTDNVPLNFRVNNQRAGRIDPNYQLTALGYLAAQNNSSYYNSAFGNFAMQNNTSGGYNSSFGSYALRNNTSGYYNSAFGTNALISNMSGYYNVAMGVNSLYSTTTGNGNTALGNSSLQNNSTGGYNTSCGNSSSSQNLTGGGNSAFGALSFGGTSDYNTAIGYSSFLYGVGSGYNTGLGAFSDASNSSVAVSMALGYGAIVNASNKCRIGGALMGITECQNGVYTVSDGRFKNKMSEEEVKGLEFIKLLRPVVYNFDTKAFTEFLTKNMPDSVKKNYLNKNFGPSSSVRQTGFIAQEVEKATEKSGYDFSGLHKPVDENDNYSINYGQFVVPLVKGMQEQQVIIEAQQQKIEKLLSKIESLESKYENIVKSTATGIEQSGLLSSDVLEQNQPNPFNHETVIKYTLYQPFNTAFIAVYDLNGKQLVSFPVTQKGQSSIIINSEKLAAGIYIYSMIADGNMLDAKRLIVTEK